MAAKKSTPATGIGGEYGDRSSMCSRRDSVTPHPGASNAATPGPPGFASRPGCTPSLASSPPNGSTPETSRRAVRPTAEICCFVVKGAGRLVTTPTGVGLDSRAVRVGTSAAVSARVCLGDHANVPLVGGRGLGENRRWLNRLADRDQHITIGQQEPSFKTALRSSADRVKRQYVLSRRQCQRPG
jgi:hypothetical protein